MTLWTVETAQADFRDNDRDGNGERDYWRGDIRGLCTLGGERRMIKLIEPSAAMADDRPVSPAYPESEPHPKGGFWYRAIRLPGEGIPNPNHWAAACHPATYGPGIRSTYVIREDGVVWRKDLGHGHGIDMYPDNPERDGWIQVEMGDSSQ